MSSQCISAEVFVPCLVDLCKALWELMKSYHRTIDWHRRHDDAMATQQAPAAATAADDADGSHGLRYSFFTCLRCNKCKCKGRVLAMVPPTRVRLATRSALQSRLSAPNNRLIIGRLPIVYFRTHLRSIKVIL